MKKVLNLSIERGFLYKIRNFKENKLIKFNYRLNKIILTRVIRSLIN